MAEDAATSNSTAQDSVCSGACSAAVAAEPATATTMAAAKATETAPKMPKAQKAAEYKRLFDDEDDDEDDIDAWFKDAVARSESRLREAQAASAPHSPDVAQQALPVRSRSSLHVWESNGSLLACSRSLGPFTPASALVASEHSNTITTTASVPTQTAPAVPEEDADKAEFERALASPENRALRHMIARAVRGFERATGGDVAQQKRALRSLMAEVQRAMQERPPWQGLPAERLQVAVGGMQQYLHEQLYRPLYEHKERLARDAEIARHYAKLRVVLTPDYLDIRKYLVADKRGAILNAVEQLQRLPAAHTPRAKLECIQRAARGLTQLLAECGANAGADDLLSVLIFAVLGAQLPHIESDQQYISDFADEDEVFGEAYCYFTHFQSATAFLDQLEPQAVFRALEQRRQDEAQRRQPPAPSSGSGSSGFGRGREEQVRLCVHERQFVGTLRFQHVSAAMLGDPDDVQLLLSEYRQLASVCRRHLPAWTGPQPWRSLPRVRPSIVEFPAGADITAAAVAGRCTWVGFRGGRVAAVDHARAAVVRVLALFAEPVAKLLVVRGALWCVARSGLVRVLDPDRGALRPHDFHLHEQRPAHRRNSSAAPALARAQAQKLGDGSDDDDDEPPAPASWRSLLPRNAFVPRRTWFLGGFLSTSTSPPPLLAGSDKKVLLAPQRQPPEDERQRHNRQQHHQHPQQQQQHKQQARGVLCVRDVVCSAKADVGWSAAAVGPSKTELCVLRPSERRVLRRVRVDGAIQQLCVCGTRLFALHADGTIRQHDPATGAVLAAIAGGRGRPLQRAGAAPAGGGGRERHGLCAAELDSTLWHANGTTLQCAHADRPAAGFGPLLAPRQTAPALRGSTGSAGSMLAAALVASAQLQQKREQQQEALEAEVVVTVSDTGRLLLWNARARTPAAVVGTAPAHPELLVCSAQPRPACELAVVVTKSNTLYQWLLEHPEQKQEQEQEPTATNM